MDRVPESSALYLNEDEAHSFISESSRGFMGAGQRIYVRSAMDRFGGLAAAQVLDVGSGPGWITITVAEHKKGWNVTGLDASPTMLAHAEKLAKKKGVHVSWVRGLAQQTGLPSAQFDLVYCSLAFHEFAEPEKVLREWLRVVRTGGTILIVDLPRPSLLSFFYLHLFSFLAIPFSGAFRRQFMASLKSGYSMDEMKKLLDGLNQPYVLKKKFFLGIWLFDAQMTKEAQ